MLCFDALIWNNIMAKLSSISFRVYIYSDFHSLVLSEKVFVLCCIWVFHQQLQTVKILKEMCCYCLVFKTHCHSFYCLWVSGDSVNLETSVSYLVIYLCPNTICFMNSGPKIKLKCAITYKKNGIFFIVIIFMAHVNSIQPLFQE